MSRQDHIEQAPTPNRRGRGCLAWLGGLALFVLAMMLGGALYEVAAEAADLRAHPAPGQMVDVGGYRLHINCTGAGNPTVVIDAGLGDWSTNWSWVQPEVAKSTRVCTYDRAGYGWSEAGPLPRTTQQFVRELHALLSQANIPGPYMLVGHSLGGFTARLFAHDYPTEVAGVVLVDSMQPADDAHLPGDVKSATSSPLDPVSIVPALARFGVFRLGAGPLGLGGLHLPPDAEQAHAAFSVRPQYFQTMLDETRAIPEGSVQVRAVHTLGDLPLVVLSRTPDNSASGRVWQANQIEMLQLSSHSQQVIADKSGHNIEIDQPEAAVEVISKMVKQIRQRPVD